jgi:cell division protein FtsA
LEVSTHIVTVASDHLAQIEDCVKKAGFRVGLFVAQPLAAGLGVLMLDDSKNGCLTVDLGAGTTDIEVFLDQAPAFTMSIPVGAQLITSDVHHLLRTSLDEAERLKLQFAEAQSQAIPPEDTVEVKQNGFDQPRPMQRKVLCEIVESRVREIVRFVREAVDESGLRESIQGGVVLTGGGAQMPNIEEAFARVLELGPVRVGVPAGLSTRSGEYHSPSWATSVGMARFALGQTDELTPVSGGLGWKDRIRTLWSMFGGGKH